MAIIGLLLGYTGRGQLKPAPIFSPHMVLQREQPIHLWGQAPAGAAVTIRLGREQRTATTGADGHWELYLTGRKASAIPQILTIRTATEQVVLDDILIGDVWVCIGQSNMEWPMAREKHYAAASRQAIQPLLRFYNPTYAGKNIYGTAFTDSVAARLTNERFYQGSWQRSDTQSLPAMSAVAWYFGKEIAGSMQVPVGLIQLAIGGAPLETFIDAHTLQRSAQFAAKVQGNWLYNDAMPAWVRERGRQNTAALPATDAGSNGPAHAYRPGFAFAAGIAPITGMPVKGILCYQGESNAQEKERVEEYGSLCSLLVADYRARWHQPRLPFYFVQLSSIDTLQYKGQWWPAFRDVQRNLQVTLPHSGMAVCSDSGARHDVHPTNKKIVGERLARWALHNEYHRSVTPSGPLPLKASYRKGRVLVRFRYAAGLQPADGSVVRGFTLDGSNEARATVHRQTIRIEAAVKPTHMYYGWSPYTDANLVNGDGLPASTFKLNVQ